MIAKVIGWGRNVISWNDGKMADAADMTANFGVKPTVEQQKLLTYDSKAEALPGGPIQAPAKVRPVVPEVVYRDGKSMIRRSLADD